MNNSEPPNTNEFCIVLVTVPDETLATTIAQTLLENHLAACINFFPIRSIYTWQSQIQSDNELQLIIKTQTKLFPTIQTTIQKLHTYETPEILAIPITSGFSPYLDWIRDNTVIS
jgi:periplasmic divalent cation tolerance protein